MGHAYEHGELIDYALWYAGRGFAVFPLQPGGKKPLISKQEGGRGYRDATTEEDDIEQWWEQEPEANIGIVTGESSGVFIVDVDGEQGEASLQALIEKHGTLPETVEVKTGQGRHLYFLMPGYDIRNSAGALGGGVDIRANGGYAVAPPSVHTSGRLYTGEIVREKIAPPPAWLLELIRVDKSVKKDPAHRALAPSSAHDMEPIAQGRRNDTIFRYASGLRAKGYDEERLFEALSRKNAACCKPPLADEELEQIVASVASYPQGDAKKARSMPVYGIGHNEWDWTDAGNASRLVEHLQGRALYCGPLGGWLLFTGQRWVRDTSNRILRAAKKTARKLLVEAAQIMDEGELEAFLKFAKSSQSAKSLKAMVELSAPEVAVNPEQFDADHMLLNLDNCVLDLDQMMLDDEHRPEHMFTMLAPVAYEEDAECPTWLAFVDRIMGSDHNLIDYLQRVVGYCLSGDTSERCIFILVGNGANGKSTFLETIAEMLGDYAAATPVETLMVKSSGGIPNDIARLKGARVVTASEGEIGQRLAESLVKRLSGQDKVTARFLHREFFEFTPQFKLFLGTNHLPQIRGSDEGVWDRIRLIPFKVRIPEAERDPKLKDKLRAELPGILNWAIQGCIEWKERGLATPAMVREATTSYRREMDLLGRFLEDCTAPEPGARVASGRLYEVYRKWCEEGGERPETKKMIGLMMKERGYETRKIQGYPNWLDLKLI